MKRKLSEKQAWLKLAAAWDKPDIDGSIVYVKFGGLELTGLCLCVDVLFEDVLISELTELNMKNKINKLPRVYFTYCWPTTLAGAAKRAAWCRKQAAKLAKRKAVK